MKKWAHIAGTNVFTVVEDSSQPSTVLIQSGFWVEAPDWVGPNDVYENGTFTRYEPPDPYEGLPPVITRFAMIDRFSDSEYSEIVLASKTDVEVQIWYDRLNATNAVNLSDPRTISGINSFVGKSLLTQVRADSILTDPVQPEERPYF